MHDHSRREEMKHSQEIFMHSKIEKQLGKLQILHLHGECQSALQTFNAFQLIDLCTSLPCWFHAVSTVFLNRYSTTLTSPTFGVSNTIQPSLSQLHLLSSLALHAGTPLTHTRYHWVSLALERDSTNIVLYP